MFVKKYIKKLLSNTSGNVALVFAISLMPIMLSVGAAIDYTRAANLRNKVAHATDAALLAAASAVLENVDLKNTSAVNARLIQEFEPFFLANMTSITGYTYNGYTLSFDPSTNKVNVDVKVDYSTTVFGIMGIDTLKTDVSAATSMRGRVSGAFSVFLVLDRSGSMGFPNGQGGIKMDSLKIAVSDMITRLSNSDPNNKFIRMGAVSYDNAMWPAQNIGWNLSSINAYVQAITPLGGTDSSAAMTEGYNKLKMPVENALHLSKSGQKPTLTLVFMTDGDNNDPTDDTATLNTCNQAKSYGMEVYTVAFQAPANGKSLLSKCASDASYYYEPENTDDLIDSFDNIGVKISERLVLSQ